MDLSEQSDKNFNRHPWELSRTDCLIKEMKKNKRIKAIIETWGGNVIDIGCGDAYFVNKLTNLYQKLNEVWGVDIFQEKDILDRKVKIVNNLDKVLIAKADLILMMDVLEHIENDIEYLQMIKDKLNKDGRLFITVPAFQFLYSLHDKELKHYRRYNFKELSKKLKVAGFEVEEWHYFYLLLIIGRLLTKNRTENLSSWKRTENDRITKLIKLILDMDYLICRFLAKVGIYLGGLSLLVIARYEK